MMTTCLIAARPVFGAGAGAAGRAAGATTALAGGAAGGAAWRRQAGPAASNIKATKAALKPRTDEERIRRACSFFNLP
jgi:hypothetical protein